jgi:adenine-specific DNA-methyltransferase
MNKYENLSKEQLIQKIITLESKKYGLVWDDEKEPEKVVVECQNNIPILKKIASKTIATDKTKPNNILIEGDNYHSLQVLNYTHKGKIDVIYIDPPYNTGNKDNKDFFYNDKWVNKEDGYKHSKWLNFMSKRLQLAHNILSESGIIVISIDDYEMTQLKLLCDDIFNEKNFIAILPTIMNLKGNNDQFGFAGTHEYTLIYSKNKEESKINEFDVDIEDIDSKWKLDSIGYYKKGRGLLADSKGKYREDRPYAYFPLLVKDNKVSLITADEYKKIYIKEKKSFNDNFISKLITKYKSLGFDVVLPLDSKNNKLRWTWGYNDKFKTDINEIIVSKNMKTGKITLNKKQRPELGDLPSKKPKTIFYKPEYSSGNGTNQLSSILQTNIFNDPNPLQLIKDLIYLTSKKDSIILDFFAGSGTTGQAILELNDEDMGQRKFILCTNNENTICENVTYPRIYSVLNGYINQESNRVDGLGGNLDYYKTDLIPIDGYTNISDSKREELTLKASNMIAIKENTHLEVELNHNFQIFRSEATNKHTAIYSTEDLEYFSELVEKVKDFKTTLYIYSYGKIDKASYSYLGSNFTIEDIPEPILDIYKEINKEGMI